MAEWHREDRVKLYLGYLETEMTIMGILSAFCVAAAAFVLKEVASADKGFMPVLWVRSADYLTLGTVFLIGAALWFYRQRSVLAWHHGQLSLSLQMAPDLIIHETPKELLESADSWDNWVHYHRGFVFVSAGISELVVGLVTALHPRLVVYSPRATFVVGSLLIVCLAAGFYVAFRRSLVEGDKE